MFTPTKTAIDCAPEDLLTGCATEHCSWKRHDVAAYKKYCGECKNRGVSLYVLY